MGWWFVAKHGHFQSGNTKEVGGGWVTTEKLREFKRGQPEGIQLLSPWYFWGIPDATWWPEEGETREAAKGGVPIHCHPWCGHPLHRAAGKLRSGVLNEFSSGCSTEFAPASLNKMPACTCPKATCKEGTEASWQRLFSRHFRGQGWPRSVGLSAVGYFWWSFRSCFRTRSDIKGQTMTILLLSGNPAMEHSLTFKKVESPKMGSSRWDSHQIQPPIDPTQSVPSSGCHRATGRWSDGACHWFGHSDEDQVLEYQGAATRPGRWEHMEVSWVMGVPPNHPLKNGIFSYKPTMWIPPCMEPSIFGCGKPPVLAKEGQWIFWADFGGTSVSDMLKTLVGGVQHVSNMCDFQA